MNNIKFRGIMPALVTPFCADNKTVNEESTKQLLDTLREQGANGFYILGATGEGIVMGREERERMCEISIKHLAKRVPSIIHIASLNFNEAVVLAKHAERSGADAIAAVPPSIFHYDEDDIFEYYKRLAASVNIPLIVYYFPGAQKDMSARLIARIFEIDNVTGVKWSSHDFYEMMKLKDMTHGEINIINGPDELLLSGLAAGADAGVGSTYNNMLPEFLQIYDLFQKGEMQKALEVQLKVNRVIDLMIRNEVIPSVKYTLGLMGIDVGTGAFPMKTFGEAQAKKYESEIRALGWPFR